MLISLTRLLTTLASIFRSRAGLQLENLALRHQIGVLLRAARKRPKLTPLDRLLWVLAWRASLWGRWDQKRRFQFLSIALSVKCGDAHLRRQPKRFAALETLYEAIARLSPRCSRTTG